MKKIGIVTDSHSGISKEEAAHLGVKLLPMPFYIGDDCYYEGVSLSREEFMRRLDAGEDVATSQPSPESVMTCWRQALEEFENILYLPISSGLSGSCDTAKVLAREEEFCGRVYVVDNGRVSTPLHRAVLDALKLVDAGYSVEEIRDKLEEYGGKMSIYIAVETLVHLKKGGRVTPAAAAIGSVLNLKPIMKFDIGKLDCYKKCRGMKKAKKEMLTAIKNDLATVYKDDYEKGRIHLMAATSADEATTAQWLREIRAEFPDLDVMCDLLTFGLSCHIGEGGLGIGVSVAVE